MSALNNLIQFAARLDGELLADFQQRVNAYMDERDRLQNERLATLQATTGTFEGVSIAGTAEQLLTDAPDTNVGEINVGDTVKCVIDFAIPQDSVVGIIIPCEYTATVQGVYGGCISLPYSENLYKKSDFRKVTPSTNSTKTEQLC